MAAIECYEFMTYIYIGDCMFYSNGIQLAMDWLDWSPNYEKLAPLHSFAHEIGLTKRDFYSVRCYPHYRINEKVILDHIDKIKLISTNDYSRLITKPGRMNRNEKWKPRIINDNKKETALKEYERLNKFLRQRID